MPFASPQTRFLLRGSALLIALLALWWFLLLNPLLFLLRGAVDVCGAAVLGSDSREFVRETPQGDWSVRVPLEIAAPASAPGRSGPTAIHSIDFDIARADVIAFTFSLPVYWAIVLAAPGIRRVLRPLVFGSLLIAVLEIVLFLAFAEIFAHKIAAGLSAPEGTAASWHLRLGEYLVVGVIPYVAPLLVAFALHRDLRSQVLRWASVQPPPDQGGGALSKKQRRRAARLGPQ
jgi:hypothetical protein